MTHSSNSLEDEIVGIAESLRRHGRSLALMNDYPTWTDSGRWRSIPLEREEMGILPHDGSWMVGDLPGVLWFVSSGRLGDRSLAARARELSLTLANRLGVVDFASVSHLFFRSSLVGAALTGDGELRELALRAGEMSLRRLHDCGYMKSFGHPDDDAYPFTTVDDVINLVLPMWFAKQSGQMSEFGRCLDAISLIEKWLVRTDGSTAQVLYFDDVGQPTHTGTYQGANAKSCWSRGLAWGIYGFAAGYEVSLEPSLREAAMRMAVYWMEHVKGDAAPPWDFSIDTSSQVVRDSFAASLGYAGILSLTSRPEGRHGEKLRRYAAEMVCRLWEAYGQGMAAGSGILRNAALDVPHNYGANCSVIVGDSYFAECLWRLSSDTTTLWADLRTQE